MRQMPSVHRARRAVLAASLATAVGLAGVSLSLSAQERQSAQREPLDRIVAVVNQGAIMQSELEERLMQARSQLTAQRIDLPPDGALREQLLEQMVIEEIQLQMARDAGLSIDDTELNRQVRRIAESNGMSVDEFADALEADGLELAAVREEIRRELVIRELQQRRVGGRVNLSPREVERMAEQEGISRQQAQQQLFQRRANDELDIWLREIRAQAFVDSRLERR